MFKDLAESIDAVMQRDPAARSRLEVLLCYPSVHVLLFHRLAHGLWRRGFRLSGRAVSQIGRWVSGIEIHPGAQIGRRFFIDHGMGVVIGETAEIGDDVTLYHGVTLGGLLPSVNSGAQANTKRHPTLEDNVIVGSGAQVLGPITVGHGARVGANAVVVRPVMPGTTVVGIPARAARREDPAREEFCAYGVSGEVADPTLRSVEALLDRVRQLSARVAALETHIAESETAAAKRDGWSAGDFAAPAEDDAAAAADGSAKGRA